MNKFCDASIVKQYHLQINQRNKAEKSQFSSIVRDYSHILKAQWEASREADALRLENEQIKVARGDPVLLRKTQEELARIKGQVSQGQLGHVMDKLEFTKEKVALAEMSRQHEKRTLALEKRNAELDHMMQVKADELDRATDELLKYKSQFQGLEASCRILDDENKQLKEDNARLAKAIMQMKNDQAEIQNKLLAGVSVDQIEEFKSSQSSQAAADGETYMRPEYIRNPVVAKVRAPTTVKQKIIAHNSEITCLTFNSDGEIVYTGGGDGLVRGWRLSDGKQVAEMVGFKKAVTGLSTSIEGDYVVASSVDGNRMHLYRTKTNAKLMQYVGHTDEITSVKFNYSQKAIISGSRDRTVRVWDTETAKQKNSFVMPNQVNSMDLGYSETMISCCHVGDVRFLAAKDGHEVYRLNKAHDDLVAAARFSPCEKFVVTTSMDHTIKVWDVRTWQELYTSFESDMYTCAGPNSNVSISPDSQYILAGSSNGAVFVLNTKKSSAALQIEEIYEDEHFYPVIACDWQPRGSHFATADQSGGLYFWKE